MSKLDAQVDKNLEFLLQTVRDGMDDEFFSWCAEAFGNPIPNAKQCEGLRNQACDKVRQAEERGLKNYHIASDGKTIYIHRSNVEALAFAFSTGSKSKDLHTASRPVPLQGLPAGKSAHLHHRG